MLPRTNKLLADLPQIEYDLLTSGMQLVSLKKGDILFETGQTPQYVYYPVGAIVSMICELGDGYSVETYMLGNTSMVGVATLNKPSFYCAKVRSTGLAYRLPVHELIRLRSNSPEYMRGAQDAWLQMTRHLALGVICGKHHSVEQQMVRWLLETLDRSLDSVICITHEELSKLLGFRREAVTLALNRFSELKYIAQRRGGFSIVNRVGLETISCDCYWIAMDKKRPVLIRLAAETAHGLSA